VEQRMTGIILIALAAMYTGEAYAKPLVYDSFSTRKAHYITIDANGDDHQTLPQAVDSHGEVAGNIITKKVSSAFKRDVHGDMLDYGTLGGGGKDGQGAFAVSIASNGDIAGYIIDHKGLYHGFIKKQDDDFDIQIDVAGGKNTKLTCMSPGGTSVGTVDLLKGVTAGFYRDILGDITIFFVNGASQTVPLSINENEMIAGVYASGSGHNGFLRNHSGLVNTFQVIPSGTETPQDIRNLRINGKGVIAGTYADGAGALHAFGRAQSSAVTTFDVEGAGTASGQGTVATDINGHGDIAGYFFTGDGVAHGFLRAAADGTIQTFDVPGASSTYVTAIDGKGAVVGYFLDSKNKAHGFLRKP
jgi:hypothetical protein